MKIGYKTYQNDRLKQVDFHGKLVYPLYIQVTYDRKPIYFKSYYFELFSKPRYMITVPGVISKAPDMEQIIELENKVLSFIIEKHRDDFSLDIFKTAYAYYSKDLCDVMEKGFVQYLQTFFWDEGNPALGDVILKGCGSIVAFDVVRDLKRIMNKEQYDKLVGNSLYYAPPYLPIYDFTARYKRWPMLITTTMELEQPETIKEFYSFAHKNYPQRPVEEILEMIGNWTKYLQ